MRQTLFHIPTELFGFPLLGNGVLFWLMLLLAVGWFAWSYLKRGLKSDDISFVVVLLIVAFLVRVFLPRIADPGQGLPIRGYGMMLMLAITSASGLLWYRARKKWNIPTDMVFSLIAWCVVSGLIGARLFHVIEYWPTYADSKNPLVAILMFSEGGLVVYGSIIGGMTGTAIFFIKSRLSILAMYDVLAPALLLGIAIGRLGCFLNGCCFGAVCEPAYGVVFPVGSPAHWTQLERNDVFLGGLKLVPESQLPDRLKGDASDVVTDETIAEQLKPAKKEFIDAELHFGGCACAGCRKPEAVKNDLSDGTPAVVAGVEPGSDAEKAGLMPGMIIRRVFVGEGDHRQELVTPSGTPDAFEIKKIMLDIVTGTPKNATPPFLELTVTEPGSNLEKPVRFQIAPPEVLPVYPTQLISFFGALGLCGLLLLLERLGNRDGWTTVLFLFLYSAARFCIELMRADEASFLGTGLSISQNVSIIVFCIAVLLTIFIFSRPPKHALAERFTGETANKGK
ncbi:MAG: prolipoprotein diacylglyceryl transferase [Planctomycetaceae bacterium]|nr:prolipoprotein diacylglyceryl transferase [Planctomycetaceae bacterium]